MNTRTAETIKQFHDLDEAINRSRTDEQRAKDEADYRHEKRLKYIRRYLKERAAR